MSNSEKLEYLDKKLNKEIGVLVVIFLLILSELTLIVIGLIALNFFSTIFLFSLSILLYKRYQKTRLTARDFLIYETIEEEEL